MKNFLSQIFVFLLMAFTLTGCSVIGDIFEAGIWVGIIVVVLVIVFVIWIIKQFIS
jgi:hypothetical protein